MPDAGRPIDEVFDVQKDVEQNPCGALMAIHSLHATVIKQQRIIDNLHDVIKQNGVVIRRMMDAKP